MPDEFKNQPGMRVQWYYTSKEIDFTQFKGIKLKDIEAMDEFDLFLT